MSHLALLLGGAASLGALFLWAEVSAGEFGDALIAGTIWVSLAWYFAALGMLVYRTHATHAARWCWTWGLVAYLAHVAASFHYFHDWSHAHAVEHTRRAGGFGGGVFVSYAFTLLWTADVVWQWAWPRGYAQRPGWVTAAVHAFMVFIVLNGAVVFATGPVRWLSLAAFLAIGGAGLRRGVRKQSAPIQ